MVDHSKLRLSNDEKRHGVVRRKIGIQFSYTLYILAPNNYLY